MIMVPRLTLSDARMILDGSEAKAKEISLDMDIALVDDGGRLLAFIRMDKARVTSIDVTINKAFTAACARKATHEYAAVAGAGGPAFGIHVSNQGRSASNNGGLAAKRGTIPCPEVWTHSYACGSLCKDCALLACNRNICLIGLLTWTTTVDGNRCTLLDRPSWSLPIT